MKFNINHTVKVRLTSYGIKILYEQWEELREGLPSIPEFTMPKKDKDGYTKYQLWVLMQTFGAYIYNGAPEQPFETNIIIGEDDD